MKCNLFNDNGVIATRKNYDSPMKDKKLRQFEEEKRNFCLNCTKPKCNGDCVDFRRFNRELYRRMCNGTT